ncbi:ATP17, subunit F of the F0 sector of mitochondrial F1F0 ATP synthase [Boletus reticuloceps]|uniref:ATP17, subunit F of the F0 sector of mitochondrial F1F0 ATP synthase n=1 Tax=Boletus reticuloceps TaxID=495285 RepID=A0A8I2YIP2_9AGAM|nr:ATP17, subunit F of the F0 sector of mitochondrial F1F0 ATP synthase [Boletus reticuloceps]
MLPTLVRRQFTGLIPPKIATPSHLSAGSGAGLAPLVNFYSKLPKGRAPPATFDPEKKALNRLGLTLLFFFGVGYTIDYNMHLKYHKNHPH